MLLKVGIISFVLFLSQSLVIGHKCLDYEYKDGAWYKFHPEGKNWEDAKNTCANEGGYLAIIDSKDEENMVLDMYKKGQSRINNAVRGDMIWLGAHNMAAGNKWMTVFGNPLQSVGYVNWSKGCDGYPPEPNNSGGNEHCLSLYGKCQGMNDYDCKYRLAFVCKNYTCMTLDERETKS